MAKLLVAAAVLMVVLVSATDPSAINDFCMADLKSTLVFNELLCKASTMVTSKEFAFYGFCADADNNNPLGIGIIPSFAGVNYPTLNTQSLALTKFNYTKGGLVPSHTHTRASEVYMGFVDMAGKLYAVTLKKDDFFLFLQGLVHFQLNSGGGHAKTMLVLNVQNPGVQLMPSALFGSSRRSWPRPSESPSRRST